MQLEIVISFNTPPIASLSSLHNIKKNIILILC